MIEYRLYADEDRRSPIATNICEDDFRAETWARNWATHAARGVDYLLEREDGNLKASIFRTAGGQWYVMRR